MKSNEWKRIKAIEVPAPRMIHISEGTYDHTAQRFKKGTGQTYDIGRNESKRTNRQHDIWQRKQNRKAA